VRTQRVRRASLPQDQPWRKDGRAAWRGVALKSRMMASLAQFESALIGE
jgi:hypothetical protein